jgi:hypothetical protein
MGALWLIHRDDFACRGISHLSTARHIRRKLMTDRTIFTVKRFVQHFGGGGQTHYSIRCRSDGLFQIYHDDPFAGIDQPYQFDDRPISGLFSDLASAEGERLRKLPAIAAEA